MFITFYGVNNIGKTTQTLRLKDRLLKMGHSVHLLKYPVYDLEPSGPFINNQLRGEAGQTVTEEHLQMWYTINRLQYQDQLKEKIRTHDFVIAEDYTETGIAWGTAKGADESWLAEINRPLLQEDIKILLVGQRIKTSVEEGHIHETNDELTDICGQVLLRRARKGGWHIIEVQPTKEATEALIWKCLQAASPIL